MNSLGPGFILAQNTTTTPQLRLTSSAGTDISSPVSGDLWWNGTALKFRTAGSTVNLLAAGSGVNYTDDPATFLGATLEIHKDFLGDTYLSSINEDPDGTALVGVSAENASAYLKAFGSNLGNVTILEINNESSFIINPSNGFAWIEIGASMTGGIGVSTSGTNADFGTWQVYSLTSSIELYAYGSTAPGTTFAPIADADAVFLHAYNASGGLHIYGSGSTPDINFWTGGVLNIPIMKIAPNHVVVQGDDWATEVLFEVGTQASIFDGNAALGVYTSSATLYMYVYDSSHATKADDVELIATNNDSFLIKSASDITIQPSGASTPVVNIGLTSLSIDTSNASGSVDLFAANSHTAHMASVASYADTASSVFTTYGSTHASSNLCLWEALDNSLLWIASDADIKISAGGSDRMTIDSTTGNIRLHAYTAGVLQTDGSGNVTAGAISGYPTLVGNNIFTGDNTFRKDSIGQTPTDAIILDNTTAASSGLQQYAPSIHWKGKGWKTDATAASKTVEMRALMIPEQGSSAPFVRLQFDSQIDGGGWTTLGYFHSVGQLVLPNGGINAAGQSFFTSTTVPQSTWKYDVNNYMSIGVSAVGITTINTVGTGPYYSYAINGTTKYEIDANNFIASVGVVPNVTNTRALGLSTNRWNKTWTVDFDASGTADIGGVTTITSTTSNQFKVAYDVSNHMTVDVSNVGLVTINATGSGARFDFNDGVRVGSNLQVTGATAELMTGTNFTTPNFTAGNYDNSSTNSATVPTGITTVRFRIKEVGSNNLTLGANESLFYHIIGNQLATEAGSGTHDWVGQMMLKGLTMTNAGGATANAATLYIESAMTGVTPSGRNVALWVKDGTYLNGNVEVSGTFTLTSGSPASGKVLTSDGSGGGTWQAAPGSYTIVNVTTTSSSPAQTSGDIIILVDAATAGGAVTINLPTAVGNTAKFTVKKIDSGANTITVDASGSQTIDGALTQVINFQNTSMTIVSNNANWFKI